MNGDCQQIRQLLDAYLDGELTVESNHAVIHHTETCRACAGEMARRERTRSLLSERLRVAEDTSSIQERITQAIDRDQRFWARFAGYGAAAALVLAIVVMGVWPWRQIDLAAFDDTIENHVVCAKALPQSRTYDSGRIARRVGAGLLDVVKEMPRTYGSYALIDAHMCPYHGRNYLHIVYRDGHQPLSIFMEPDTRGALPTSTASTTNGYVSTASIAGGHHVFVVHDSDAPPPPDVVNSLLGSSVALLQRLGPDRDRH